MFPLSADDRERLARLASVWPERKQPYPRPVKLLLVTPRPGTISPWSSKATDISLWQERSGAGYCVLKRSVAYYVTKPQP